MLDSFSLVTWNDIILIKNKNQFPIEIKSLHYLNRYLSFCYNIQKSSRILITKNNHHIIPKSFGGSNESFNIVQLTYREHFIAHRILSRCFSGIAHQKMILAFSMMMNINKHMKLTSKEFEKIRNEYIKSLSSSLKNRITIFKENSMKRIGPEELVSFLDDGWKIGIPDKMRCDAITKANSGKKYINRDDESMLVYPDELEQYLSEGWSIGTKKTHRENIGRTKHGRIQMNLNGKIMQVEEKDVQQKLDDGWSFGAGKEFSELMKGKTKGWPFVTKDDQMKRIPLDELQSYLDDGWMIGTNDSHKEKSGNSTRGKKWIHKGTEHRRVFVDELQTYLNVGWVAGRSAEVIKKCVTRKK